jgi:hypothetical protein
MIIDNMRKETEMPQAIERVKMAVGLTINLGDYQSLRVDVGLERECDTKYMEDEFDTMQKELTEQLEKSVGYFEKATRKLTGREKRS